MTKNQLNQYWPVIVGSFKNLEHNLIKDELINFFKDYEKINPKGNKQLHDKNYTGNHNLYQSNYNLHNEKNEVLRKVFKFIAFSILETVSMVNSSSIKDLDIKKPQFDVKLIESWFIRYNQGGMVYPHNHAGFSWSCVYYVQVGKEAKKMNGSTYFMKPYNPQCPPDFGGSYLKTEHLTIDAEEGKLIIFPSYLYHGSHPFFGESDRIIISVNSMTELKK